MDTYKFNKDTVPTAKSTVSIRSLIDVEENGGNTEIVDGIKNNQVLVAQAYYKSPGVLDKVKAFRFKYLDDVIKAGSGITVTQSNGEITIATSGGSYVPYTGATGNVDLGEYELKAGQIEFDQTPTGTAGIAVMRWNDTDGTVDVGMKGGNVTLQVGQEQLARVVNKVGSDLLEADYQVVRVRLVSEGGAAGQRLAVVLAQANNDTNSATTIGIVTETILNNQEGFVTTSGVVREIDTTGSLQGETWVDGDILYLSGTTAGQLTNIKPSAPTHTIIIGFVEYAHANHGKIFVKVDNGYEIDELHNVNISSPATNDILQYNSSGLWVNNNPPIINIITTTDGTAVTGTTSGTLTGSILIPANTVATGDMLYIKTRIRKTGTAGTVTTRMYINTSAAIGGSLIATSATAVATSLYFQYARTLAVKSSTNTESMAGNLNVNADDNLSVTTAVSASNIDWTVDQYLCVVVTNSSTADTSRSSFVHLQINKA
jgi:hypothetical protein